MREGDNPQEFVYNSGEDVHTNVCRFLRYFRYQEFSGPQDLLKRLSEFTVVATGEATGEVDLSEAGRDGKDMSEKLLVGQDGRVWMFLRHIPTWNEQQRILKEKKALEIEQQKLKLKQELEQKQSLLKR